MLLALSFIIGGSVPGSMYCLDLLPGFGEGPAIELPFELAAPVVEQDREQADIEYLQTLTVDDFLEQYRANPRRRNLIINTLLPQIPPTLVPLPENIQERYIVYLALPGLPVQRQAEILSQLTQEEISQLLDLSPPHQDLFNTYRQNVTTLDLTREGRINREFIERIGETYPNVQRLIINAESTQRPGYVGITPKLADVIVGAFPHLKFMKILGCDFSQPLISGLNRLSMLKSQHAKIAVEYTQKCAERALI